MDKYKKGDIVNAIITNTQPYGVFASFDGDYSGLIHISEITDKYVKDINDYVEVGDEHVIPVSHGEGRFVAPQEVLDDLIANGQVAFQYVDEKGEVTMESPYNPNGSMYAIEGIVSKDGRVLGKMGHSERQGENRNLNIYGEMDQKLFEAGVAYFKKEQ